MTYPFLLHPFSLAVALLAMFIKSKTFFSSISQYLRIIGYPHLAILFSNMYNIFCESFVSPG